MNRPFVIATAVIGVLLVGATTAGAAPPEDPAPVATADVRVDHQPDAERASPLIVDQLADSTVLTIRARNFDGDATGRVSQCVAGAIRRCGNQLPVRFDAAGSTTFQYLVRADAADAGDDPCRLDGPRCTIELTSGDRSTTLDTVFIDEAPPPGRLDVSPDRDLDVGETVTITATEFPEGVDLLATVCAAPSTSGSRCGSPAPVVRMTVGPDGSATARMTLDVTEVGAEQVACGRQTLCRVVVSSDRALARARPVALAFRAAPPVRYSTGRLMVGLAAASAFLVTAGFLIRTGDWTPPLEADARSIEDADFADLDAEADVFADDSVRSRRFSDG